ncbi:MAG: DNA mismatch repair endonuclease MutL [Candidatus Binatia bacterium]
MTKRPAPPAVQKAPAPPAVQKAPAPPAVKRIALLDEGTVAGIAAGEVVERPASAVKELVENALDAGAAHVRVDYDDRGPMRITVTDDGSGIEDAEIDLALTRHATSKIRTLADLENVVTFGFRGEALAAIASASDLELVTAVEGRTGGTRVLVRAGRIVERSPASSRRGTRIDVQDLFATVPARRKFLKGSATEAGYVADVVRRFALARPDVHFVLTVSGRVSLDVAPVASDAERIRQVFGKDVAESLVAVDARLGSLRLRGLVSPPGVAYGSSRRMAIFVGGRWVRERLLFQSVLEGYQTYLLKGRFPAVSLFFECEAGSVDVNVHPAKLEVRFSDPDRVRSFVAEAVRDALRRSASPLGRWGIDASESLRRRAVPTTGPGAVPAATRAWGAGGKPPSIATFQEEVHDEPVSADSGIPGYTPSLLPDAHAPAEEKQLSIDLGAAQAAEALGRFQVIGQIFEGYFVCEGDGEVLLVDQHASHERVLFERLMQAFAERDVARQALLLAARVHVGRDGVEACASAAAELEALGWEIEVFGEEDVVVRAVPAMAGAADARALVEAVARDLVEMGRARSAERLAERIMATVACHSAVRVGKRLDVAAARALLREMATVSYHATCPHGRPVARKLARGQIERMFGR